MYTAPAYFMACIVMFTIAMILTFFQGRERISTVKEQKKPSKRRTAIDEFANGTPTWLFGLTVYDACILGCMLLNVSSKGCIAAFETMGISYAESHFQMVSSRAGTIVASSGLIGVFALLAMGHLSKYFSDVQLIYGGMGIMAFGIVSLAGFNETVEDGIDDKHNPTWRYVFAIFLIYAVGYPIGHTAVIGLFSKIVGRRPQGMLLGWFASAGSLARIMFPVFSGYIARYSSMSALFLLLTSVLTVSVIFVVSTRKTLSLLSS